MLTTGAHGVEKIPDIKPRLDVLHSEQFTPWTQSLATLVDYFCRQRNITGDHQVVLLEPLDNLVISNVIAGRHQKEANVARRRHTHIMVCNECRLYPCAISGSKQCVLYHPGAGIRINPYVYFRNFRTLRSDCQRMLSSNTEVSRSSCGLRRKFASDSSLKPTATRSLMIIAGSIL